MFNLIRTIITFILIIILFIIYIRKVNFSFKSRSIKITIAIFMCVFIFLFSSFLSFFPFENLFYRFETYEQVLYYAYGNDINIENKVAFEQTVFVSSNYGTTVIEYDNGYKVISPNLNNFNLKNWYFSSEETNDSRLWFSGVSAYSERDNKTYIDLRDVWELTEDKTHTISDSQNNQYTLYVDSNFKKRYYVVLEGEVAEDYFINVDGINIKIKKPFGPDNMFNTDE